MNLVSEKSWLYHFKLNPSGNTVAPQLELNEYNIVPKTGIDKNNNIIPTIK